MLAAYNAVVFLMYAVDKLKARQGWWRVPEATLLWMAALFGGAGALAGIYLLRHKTRKPAFTWGVGMMAAVQAALLFWGRQRGWW